VAGLAESGDNVFVGDGVPEHVVDHVALDSGEGGNAAVAADFAWLSGSGQWLGFNESGSLVLLRQKRSPRR